MVYITRVEHFNAAHRLFNKDWSNEENFRIFGKCSHENWHGHNYELHITVKGETDPVTGFVFNAKTLSDIVKERILEKVDHKNLNLDVDFMQGINPTAEQFAMAIWRELCPLLEDGRVKMHCVKLIETPRIYVEYYGN